MVTFLWVKKWLLCGSVFFSAATWAWNAEGHRLVAQIAYNHMTPSAKARFQAAHPALDKKEPATFTEAAVWFDGLRGTRFPGIPSMHYADIPIIDFPEADTPSQNKTGLNGLMAYQGARSMLLSGEGGALHQAIALRILLHVTADLHQPLHAATRLSAKYPDGDLGGNKTRLPKNKVSRNLHAYWDRGGGFLLGQAPTRIRAQVLEKLWPCEPRDVDTNPVHWLAESHVLAETKVYRFNRARFLSERYQSMVNDISQERLALAGCRLAAVLNEIDVYGVPFVG